MVGALHARRRPRRSVREPARRRATRRAPGSLPATLARASVRAHRGRVGSPRRRVTATPETRYARSGDVNIAYQIVGEGPLDLVYVPGWISNVELNWDEPSHAHALERLAPSEDEAFKRRLATYFRRSASPGAAVALMRMNTQIDIRDVLPAIQAPTLVMHRTHDRDVKVEEGRWITSQIPGAKYVELTGDAHTLWAGNTDEIVDEIEEFL